VRRWNSKEVFLEFSGLKNNISDVIKEEQIKLGYQKEAIRLYYPLKSLNSLLKAACDNKEMHELLKTFCESVRDCFGEVSVTSKGDRFCFYLPPEASEYVYEHTEKTGFLYDFISTVSRHGASLEEILSQFRKYSGHVHVERVSNGEFDYLVYFEDGKPDAYRYCLTDEGGHIIYHRFTVDDYQEF
jgi:hypothetical protein